MYIQCYLYIFFDAWMSIHDCPAPPPPSFRLGALYGDTIALTPNILFQSQIKSLLEKGLRAQICKNEFFVYGGL